MPTPVVPLEVWLADIRWGHAAYRRPVVFMGERPGGIYVVFRTSTNFDLRGDRDFTLDRNHPDFGATGLDDSSYVEARMQELSGDKFVRQLGAVEGGLQSAFVRWLKRGVVER